MPAYAYPIKISKSRQTIEYIEHFDLDVDTLTTSIIAPIVGEFPFDIRSDCYGVYSVTVYKNRKETDAEMRARISKEESYMAEYNHRKARK